MSSPSTHHPDTSRSWGADLTFFGATLATYLAVVFTFSFSHESASARHAINIAILLIDAVLLARIVRPPGSVRRKLVLPAGVNAYAQTACWVLIILVVLLHCDYLRARYRGAEDGLAGSLSNIKGYLLLCQVSAVFAWAIASSPSWRLRADRLDVLVFSLVLVPLANYLARNKNDFTALATIEFVGLFLAIPVIAFVLLQLLQRGLGGRASPVALAAGLTFVHYSMPMVSAALERPIEDLFFVQVGLAAAFSTLLAILYGADRKALATASVVYTVVSVAASIVMAAYMRTESRAALTPVPVADPTLLAHLSGPARRTPDVYLLVYDGYAAPSMLRRYGIDNDPQLEYLVRNRFVVYGQAYSRHLSSLASMSSVMNMGAVSQIGIGGATRATQFFRNQGYRTNLILNSHLLKGSENVEVDHVFPPVTYRSGLDALYRGIGGGEFKSEIVFQDSPREEWLSAKRAAIASEDGKPRMLYAHSGLPGHSQNSGRCLDDEVQRYADRLGIANREIKDDVDAILQTGRESIVIVAGDHGPYLTGDCLYLSGYQTEEVTADHLADRYGTMLAIRWPEGYEEFDRISTIQDVFVAVSAYLLDDVTVLGYKPPAVTTGYGGIPDHAVQDGIVTLGSDSGMPLMPTDDQLSEQP